MSCCGGRGRSSRGRSRRFKAKTALEVKALMNKEYRAHILMCRPKYYDIDYVINPWMDTKNGANHKKATEQWNMLESKIKELGAKVHHVPPQKNLPDLVFTANAGYIKKREKTFVLSNFLHKERKGEEQYFEEWFSDNGYEVVKVENYFEGAGDALYFGNDLILGHGFRTDVNVCDNLNESSIHTVRLTDPHFYHLDTCFCPLQDKDYIIFPGAFDEESLCKIRNLGNEITIIESEAKQFACNAVVIDKNVIIPSGCPDTVQKLEQAGYSAHEVEMSEFIKSGGACKCLTITIM